MTRLGQYLESRSINKADVARKIGSTPQRMNDLTRNINSHPRASEVYLIAKAIGANPCELLEFLCQDLEINGK